MLVLPCCGFFATPLIFFLISAAAAFVLASFGLNIDGSFKPSPFAIPGVAIPPAANPIIVPPFFSALITLFFNVTEPSPNTLSIKGMYSFVDIDV